MKIFAYKSKVSVLKQERKKELNRNKKAHEAIWVMIFLAVVCVWMISVCCCSWECKDVNANFLPECTLKFN